MRTRMENRRARTPPSLFGIERRMARANRKYHSGLMCGGVTSGFAGMKLSGSPKRLGVNSAMHVRPIRRATKPRRSLKEKNQVNHGYGSDDERQQEVECEKAGKCGVIN